MQLVGGEPSKQGDIYSCGILVLEMFTGRRPTEEMFKDGFSLHNFVKMAIPERVMQFLDPALLATVEQKAPPAAATENEVNYISGYNIEIKAEEENINSEKLGKMSPYVSKCIVPILKIGLPCSELMVSCLSYGARKIIDTWTQEIAKRKSYSISFPSYQRRNQVIWYTWCS